MGNSSDPDLQELALVEEVLGCPKAVFQVPAALFCYRLLPTRNSNPTETVCAGCHTLPACTCRQYGAIVLTMARKGVYESLDPPVQLPLAPVPHWEPACVSSCLNVDVLALRSALSYDGSFWCHG